MRIIEKPDRIDRQITRAVLHARGRNRRIPRVELNPVESRIFWEDLIEDGKIIGDPLDDGQFAAFVLLGNYDYDGVTVKLNVDGV